jgi:diaminopimelate decarboxylase
MKDRILSKDISETFKKAFNKEGLINNNDSAIIFYDLDFLNERVDSLKQLFPKNTIHAIAVKANPLIRILEEFRDANVGLETASLPELFIAEKLGFSSNKIVFDSPSKTIEEIEYALKLGTHLNADSFIELVRISKLYKVTKSVSNIGLRINPQVSSGTIKSTSVADNISKFGIPINEHRQEIIDSFFKYKWLNGIHLHVGSQGISIIQLLNGLKKVYELVEEINSLLKIEGRQIVFFDIGGGFPVSYNFDESIPCLEEYITMAKSNHPELFSGKYKLITEFGRYISANTAWAASRVEYVKDEPDFKILSTHLGADFLLRKAYNPSDWHHEISVLDRNGNIKTGIDNKKYIIAGPLCFAGDIIAKDIELPKVEQGDYIVIHDIGAYTLSMWSRYNSRQMPKVIGYKNKSFHILKERERLEDLYNFWK